MRKKTLIIGIGAVFMLVLVLGTAAYAVSPSGGLSIPWWTTDSGTCSSTGGAYELSGTVGQPDAGVSSGGTYSLFGGFQSIGGGSPCTLRTHLAITIR
jgi:hypothetical protein